jgi:hypothetical protein
VKALLVRTSSRRNIGKLGIILIIISEQARTLFKFCKIFSRCSKVCQNLKNGSKNVVVLVHSNDFENELRLRSVFELQFLIFKVFETEKKITYIFKTESKHL